MSDWYSIWVAAQIRQQEVDRELAHRRLVREALGTRRKRFRVPGKVLLTPGCWLVEQGWQLHADYGMTSAEVLRWGRIEIRTQQPYIQP